MPLSQMWAVASHVLRNKLKRNSKYPLVLMLEPLFRCNLSCAGCGKVQYPAHVLKKELTPEECFRAVEECGVPVVSIPGGEPLLHSRIVEIIEGLVERKKYVYLCTNAVLLGKKLDLLRPSKYLTISVHLDGLREEHDFAVCREGVFDVAYAAIREALGRGFRVTTNTTLFEGADPERVRAFFDEMTKLGVEGMTISPGYSYSKAPDQEHFLRRSRTRQLFARVLRSPRKGWRFNQSPLFLEFLAGGRDYQCTPWGTPTYNVFGWQRPCYLLQDGYAESFRALMETTDWERYGRGRDDRCADCMVHCGYEPSAVDDTFSGLRGLLATVRAMIFGSRAGSAEEAESVAKSDPALGEAAPVGCEPALDRGARVSIASLESPAGEDTGAGAARPAPGGVSASMAAQSSDSPVRDPAGVDPSEGAARPARDPEELRRAIEAAFDYRGDVTLELSGGGRVEGYLFNRDLCAAVPFVDVFISSGGVLLRVACDQIEGVLLTGKDMASGRSWEAWVAECKSRKGRGAAGGVG